MPSVNYELKTSMLYVDILEIGIFQGLSPKMIVSLHGHVRKVIFTIDLKYPLFNIHTYIHTYANTYIVFNLVRYVLKNT